ncbi:hypothetical protein Acsp06_40760 [Actinomycetospora sp. NBRC 106375]|nr:hypothetical protein Acsp06_40760 [Actinomycetospora sp. NBRC 106375]
MGEIPIASIPTATRAGRGNGRKVTRPDTASTVVVVVSSFVTGPGCHHPGLTTCRAATYPRSRDPAANSRTPGARQRLTGLAARREFLLTRLPSPPRGGGGFFMFGPSSAPGNDRFEADTP